MGKELLLSIIITSYSTERLNDIFELLDSIKGQSYANVETIFVAERRSELFSEVKRYVEEKTIPNVRIVFNHGKPGLSPARNLGIKESQGDIMAFLDDDALPAPDWADEVAKTYNDESVIGVTGPISPLWQDGPMEWFPSDFDWILSCSAWSGITEKREMRNVWGTNMSFRREAFDSSGLFLTALGAKGGGVSGKHEPVAEETELSIRVRTRTGKRILYNPSVRVWHRVYRYRVASVWIARRAYWEGYTKAILRKLYGKGDENLNTLGPEYALLRRILFRLLPNILKGFFTGPLPSWRKLRIMVIVLFFVVFGYLRGIFFSRTENT